jgi:DNA mismatch repair protein MSH3
VQEQQIVVLKQQHPGVLLLVEVGYKMCMFGHDAEVVAKVWV